MYELHNVLNIQNLAEENHNEIFPSLKKMCRLYKGGAHKKVVGQKGYWLQSWRRTTRVLHEDHVYNQDQHKWQE